VADQGAPEAVGVVLGVELIPVGEIEPEPVKLDDRRSVMPDQAAGGQLRAPGKFMIAGEQMDFNPLADNFRKGSEHRFVCGWRRSRAADPEVEEIAENEKSVEILRKLLKKPEQVLIGGLGGRQEMGVGKEDGFHARGYKLKNRKLSIVNRLSLLAGGPVLV